MTERTTIYAVDGHGRQKLPLTDIPDAVSWAKTHNAGLLDYQAPIKRLSVHTIVEISIA